MEIQNVQYNLRQLRIPHLPFKSLVPSHVEVGFRDEQPILPLAKNLMDALVIAFPWNNLESQFNLQDGDVPAYHSIISGRDTPSEHYVGIIVAKEQDIAAKIYMHGRIGQGTVERFLEGYAKSLKELIPRKVVR